MAPPLQKCVKRFCNYTFECFHVMWTSCVMHAYIGIQVGFWESVFGGWGLKTVSWTLLMTCVLLQLCLYKPLYFPSLAKSSKRKRLSAQKCNRADCWVVSCGWCWVCFVVLAQFIDFKSAVVCTRTSIFSWRQLDRWKLKRSKLASCLCWTRKVHQTGCRRLNLLSLVNFVTLTYQVHTVHTHLPQVHLNSVFAFCSK